MIVFLLLLFVMSCSPQAEQQLPMQTEPNVRLKSKTFTISGISDLVFGGYEQWYTEEHGQKILEARYCFQTFVEAEKVRNDYIIRANTIIERKENLDSTDSTESFRYVFASDYLKEGKFAILTGSKGKCFELVSAASLDLTMDFESRYKSK